MGNWAEIPWIVCANQKITSSAQTGYYIVLLFSADMQSCYISLNQGVTKSNAQHLTYFSNVAAKYTKPSTCENLIYGEINLNAKNILGKAYEQSAIKSYRYSLEDLKYLELNKKIENQFKELIQDYENIFGLIGTDILNLQPVTDYSYQEEIQKTSLDMNDNELDKILPKPTKNLKHFKYYTRNPKFSKAALKNANYECEINPQHQTFNNGKHQYMEGHHIVPMSLQDYYEISLDVPSNIISVCPNCHRALHYGDSSIKIEYLNLIFKNRKLKLEKHGIIINKKTLENIYVKNQLDHEYD